ncbi:MAG: DNA repair protein RecN, partial [Clostridia bacterium]|nr:DNA repair protein RecN [Clostridia bacterium]
GADKQVICVTHLAQIAALADTQFAVEKRVEGERTVSTVNKLDGEGRLSEIARLVGGAEKDLSGIEHARSMLSGARARKTERRGKKEC